MGDLLLILLGAAVGFVGSVVGSVIVGHNDLRRQTRVMIYRDLLPEIWRMHKDGDPDLWAQTAEKCAQVERAAVVLSRSEWNFTVALSILANARTDAWSAHPNRDTYGVYTLTEEQQRLSDEFEGLLAALDRRVSHRLRWNDPTTRASGYLNRLRNRFTR